MLRAGCAILLSACFLFGTARADDLSSLVREYTNAIGKVGGKPSDRASKAKKSVQPIVVKIGKLDSDKSLAWLVGELDKKKVMAEVRATIPYGIVESSNDSATQRLLRGMSRRPAEIQSASLKALRSKEKALSAEECEALVSQLAPASKRRSAKGSTVNPLVDAVNLLKHVKDPDAKEYLATKAYKGAGSNTGRLFVLARVAAELKLTDARSELTKLVSSRSSEVAGAAIEALGTIGVGDAASAIAKAISKGRGDVGMRMRALDALAAANGEGVDVVIESAKSKDPELRAVAMGSLALLGSNARAVQVLVDGLSDKDPSVRNVALRALGRVRAKPMIGGLIDAVFSSRDKSFQVKALGLLVSSSGQNFGLVEADWKKWWSVAKTNFEFPKGEKDGGTLVKVRGLEYFGIEVSSKRLGIIVDISSSMRQMVDVREGALDEDDDDEYVGKGGKTRVKKRKDEKKGKDKKGGKMVKAPKIDVLKKELSRLIKKLPADTFINILSFDANYRTWQKQLQPIRGRGRAKALAYVKAITTGSGTNVYDTLEHALKDKRVDTIYLMTDGRPTRGKITDAAGILKAIGEQNRVRGVTIHTIAFGEESKLLEDLADQNGGQYRFVDSY